MLITGGTGDIGAAAARRLLSSGAQVATLDLRAAELDDVLALTGGCQQLRRRRGRGTAGRG